MEYSKVIQQRIIDLSAEEAKRFLMKQDSFCNISLPKYFCFQKLLDAISEEFEDKSYRNIKNLCGNKLRPHNIPNVNYQFFQNKDGLFSWRPLQIINPVIYTYLVSEITETNNWELLVNRFKEFNRINNIFCYSLPIPGNSLQTNTADTVQNWWNDIEQQSIKLALDYNYLMITDISDCYASVYTHSIVWAMCDEENAKKIFFANQRGIRKEDKKIILESIPEIAIKRYDIGDTIDKAIREMSYQQTNGIPQGSVLMDFIAELILGYADLKISKAIEGTKIIDYKILRYRDDYRIFGKTQEDVIKIAKILTEVLSKLNFKLNTQKTILTQDLVCDAIKADKLYYIIRDYKRLEESDNHYTLQKHLLRINQLALKHPNSGSLQKAMDKFFKRICEWKDLDLIKEVCSFEVLISIVTNIAFNNTKVYKQYVGIVGKILSYETNAFKREEIINKILQKFHKMPNVGYLELWLQRLTIKDNRKKIYFEELCKCAAGENVSIWNFDWLKNDLKNIVTSVSFIDEEAILHLPKAIEYKEFESFNKY